jgi:tripartite-type tricarboxylate transporter receptor subunit TctC
LSKPNLGANKPINGIIPYTPGGSTDNATRMVAAKNHGANRQDQQDN